MNTNDKSISLCSPVADETAGGTLLPYVRPVVEMLAVNEHVLPLMASGNTGGSHDPSGGGNSGHGSSGDGSEGGNNGHDPSTGEDIGDDNPGKGWDWDDDLTYYNSYKVL